MHDGMYCVAPQQLAGTTKCLCVCSHCTPFSKKSTLRIDDIGDDVDDDDINDVDVDDDDNVEACLQC